ncbi:MAG: rRNA maturation RNase YbeY [Candidatus Pacebacteria bacterium]|nr:rRNA maturation RNase YbeY [Candidatus Paceibacterota bacterium]
MFDIKNTTRKNNPSLPFQKIKEKVLGKNYELSLVFIGDQLSKKLNNQYRKINKATNILTFNLSKTEGEIFINLNLAKKQAHKFEKNYTNFIGLLLIHGLMHLKGYQHSSKMDKEEEKIRKFFKI